MDAVSFHLLESIISFLDIFFMVSFVSFEFLFFFLKRSSSLFLICVFHGSFPQKSTDSWIILIRASMYVYVQGLLSGSSR